MAETKFTFKYKELQGIASALNALIVRKLDFSLASKVARCFKQIQGEVETVENMRQAFLDKYAVKDDKEKIVFDVIKTPQGEIQNPKIQPELQKEADDEWKKLMDTEITLTVNPIMWPDTREDRYAIEPAIVATLGTMITEKK